MIKVTDQKHRQRIAQIVGPGPKPSTQWARTDDQYPAEWLLIREHADRQTGKTVYEVVPQ